MLSMWRRPWHPYSPSPFSSLIVAEPSAVTKLLAAWDGLGMESQILILAKLKTTPRPGCLSKRILSKALETTNPYIRYLAANSLRVNGDEAIKQRIEQDPDALVRYSLLETLATGSVLGDSDLLEDPDAFLALPHEARLAVVRSMVRHGKQIAAVLDHAIDHQLKEGVVSDIELFEILSDYVNKPVMPPLIRVMVLEISARFGNFFRSCQRQSPTVDENLPATIVREKVIPDAVLKELNTRQIEKLLYRSDVGLEQFRKEVFWRTDPRDFMTLLAATSHSFNLDYEGRFGMESEI